MLRTRLENLHISSEVSQQIRELASPDPLASRMQFDHSMRNAKAELLRGYALMPHDLLQAGWPLKLDLYRYTPMRHVLELYGKQGEVLELAPFLELTMNPTILILVEEKSLARFRETESRSIFDLELEEAA